MSTRPSDNALQILLTLQHIFIADGMIIKPVSAILRYGKERILKRSE